MGILLNIRAYVDVFHGRAGGHACNVKSNNLPGQDIYGKIKLD